jgi:hypothetical protein
MIDRSRFLLRPQVVGMDRSMQFRHLAEAERHIALGARHISNQELRIAELEAHRRDSTLACSLLKTFRLTQAQHVAHRDQILRELGL